MELFFSQASVAVEVLGFGYIAGSFVVYTHQRLNCPSDWKARATSAAKQKQSEIRTTVQRKLSPVEQLRQQCQSAGIKWRDAHGKNKHLKKAEMIEALRRLENAKRVAKSPSKPTESRPADVRKRIA